MRVIVAGLATMALAVGFYFATPQGPWQYRCNPVGVQLGLGCRPAPPPITIYRGRV